MTVLATMCWPESRRAEAIAEAAARMGIAAPVLEPVDTRCADVEERLAATGPAIVRLGGASRGDFAVVLRENGGTLSLLAPSGAVHAVPVETLADRLWEGLAGEHANVSERALETAHVPAARQRAARRALLRRQFGTRPVDGIVRITAPFESSLAHDLRRAGVLRRAVVFLAAHCVQYLVWLASWWMVGRAALEGRFDHGWFVGWALLLTSTIPFRLLATSAQGALAISAGAVLKRKLLDAALRLEPQAVRGQGVGTFVGRVIEAEAVEALALSGGILALTAAVEIVIAGVVMALPSTGPLLWPWLAAWCLGVLGLGAHCLRRRRAWTDTRLHLTHELVEKMIGHRTRLVQGGREWHAGEDAALERYVEQSRAMDAATARLVALAPRGFMLLGILACTPWIVAGGTASADLAVALGGVLLAEQALTRLVLGLADLGGAVISWRQVVPMLAALRRTQAAAAREVVPAASVRDSGAADVAGDADADADGAPRRLLGARDLAFTHPRRVRPVFEGLDLEIRQGDRILLEGASGSGKSTLVSVLMGLRAPDSGVLLLRGVDRSTLGDEEWRRQIAAAPQFHENHVLTESFAFNLLMGRRWPPRDEDVEEAERLCRDLGLGELLDRMPAGMFEMIGDGGWQLSHGERSRLFMARALLQRGDLVVLDESFTALDPTTQATALRCALARSTTLLVVAHP